MTTEERFYNIKALLGCDPYGLICRLYDLAASMRQDGDMSQVADPMLAARLEFTGQGSDLRRILTKAGYLDRRGKIVGWDDDIFRLYDSIRKNNQKRGLKSAALRAAAKASSLTSQTGSVKTEQDITGEQRTATVQRPVEPLASAPRPSSWPKVLTEKQITEISEATQRSPEFIISAWTIYCDQKKCYRDDYANGEGIAGFRHYLRVTKVTPPAPRCKVPAAAAPEGWREMLEALHPENAINQREDTWENLHPKIQKEVIAALKGEAASSN